MLILLVIHIVHFLVLCYYFMENRNGKMELSKKEEPILLYSVFTENLKFVNFVVNVELIIYNNNKVNKKKYNCKMMFKINMRNFWIRKIKKGGVNKIVCKTVYKGHCIAKIV